MKVLLLSFFLSSLAFADHSISPIDCGTYKITAPANITSVDHMFLRMQIGVFAGTKEKTKLDLTWQSQEKFRFLPTSWVSGIIYLRKRTGPAKLEGVFESAPLTLGPASEKNHHESIELIEARPCSQPKF